jgi:ATP-dependent DNA ligase
MTKSPLTKGLLLALSALFLIPVELFAWTEEFGNRDQGLTVAEMKRCRWVKPVIVCQVKFTEWTRDDRLRQPVFLGIRTDKSS